MSFYGVGETYRDEFNTYDDTNVLTNADATPTGILVVNGTDTGTTVTIANPSAGRYKLSVSLAGLAFGDDFWVYVTATVGGLTQARKFPTYRIVSPGPIAISDGTAQAGTTTTITLAADTVGGSNAYVDRTITIVAGTGTDQSRWIEAYNSTTKVATVHRDWDTVPDATSEYVIESTSAANTTAIAGSVTAANALERSSGGIVLGTVGAGASFTSIPTSSLDPVPAATDQFKSRALFFHRTTLTPELRGKFTDVTASTAGGVLTVTSLGVNPASGDTFSIL